MYKRFGKQILSVLMVLVMLISAVSTTAFAIDLQTVFGKTEYSAKVEHPDRFELNSVTAQIEQSNRRN